MTRSLRAGFSLVELLVVIGIIGIVSALAVPQLTVARDNARLRDMARKISGSLQVARQQAIATGSNHVVYMSNFVGIDMCGNPFPTDPVTGAPMSMLILNDGPPGPGTNCCIDAGETFTSVAPDVMLNWGLIAPVPPQHPNDTGGAFYNTGTSFTAPNGGVTFWTMFRPDGVPVALSFGCVAGPVGSGGGGIYVNNQRRNYSVILAPLGAVKVYSFDRGSNAWTN